MQSVKLLYFVIPQERKGHQRNTKALKPETNCLTNRLIKLITETWSLLPGHTEIGELRGEGSWRLKSVLGDRFWFYGMGGPGVGCHWFRRSFRP